jgi:hypothetical protein
MLFDPVDNHLVTLTANRVTRKAIAPGFMQGNKAPAALTPVPVVKTVD